MCLATFVFTPDKTGECIQQLRQTLSETVTAHSQPARARTLQLIAPHSMRVLSPSQISDGKRKNARFDQSRKKLMRCKQMKTFNRQDPGLTSAWSEVGRTEVMAMTDIYRLTHPPLPIQLYQGISAVNLVWEDPLEQPAKSTVHTSNSSGSIISHE